MSSEHNRETYDRYGAAYHAKRQREEDSTWNRYLDLPAIEKLLAPLPAPRHVLDLGCGSGVLAAWLKERGGQIAGIDFSETLIEIARRETPDVEFTVGDIRQTPFADASFDLVVSALVMHYLRDLEPAFAEVARVLKPGGSFIFTMHHPVMEVLQVNDSDLSHATMRPYFHNEEYRWRMLGDMELVSYHHTFEDISNALFAHGFVIEQIREARFVEEAKDRYPQYYTRTNTYPSFVGFRACRRS